MGFLSDLGAMVMGKDARQVGGGDIKNVSKQSPEQRAMMNETLLPFLRSESLAGLRDTPVPLGATGVTSLGESSLAALEQMMQGGEAGDSADLGREALRGILTRGPTDIDEFFKTNIQSPMIEALREEIMPQTARTFGGNAMFSSERQEADARSREDLSKQLVASRADVSLKARESDTNAILNAVQRLGEVERLEPSVIQAALQAGETVRAQETEGLQAEREEELRQRAERDKRIAQILAALGLDVNENIAFAPLFAPAQTGALQEALGTGMSIAGYNLGTKVG